MHSRNRAKPILMYWRHTLRFIPAPSILRSSSMGTTGRLYHPSMTTSVPTHLWVRKAPWKKSMPRRMRVHLHPTPPGPLI